VTATVDVRGRQTIAIDEAKATTTLTPRAETIETASARTATLAAIVDQRENGIATAVRPAAMPDVTTTTASDAERETPTMTAAAEGETIGGTMFMATGLEGRNSVGKLRRHPRNASLPQISPT
jgi:hypothetical protein